MDSLPQVVVSWPTDMPDLPPLDVLVVDDEPAVARLVQVVLEREGLVVDSAHDGLAALRMLSERDVHVVLTDFTMPEIDGLELVRRAERSGSRAAYLVMSAYLESQAAAALCAEPAVAGLLGKPFQLTELLADVRAVLASRRARPEAPRC